MTGTGAFSITVARADDLRQVVALLADDPLGSTRETAGAGFQAYRDAFSEIEADPNNMVLVAEDAGKIVGCAQVTFIANLSFEGGRRALVEAVRVADSHQGRGLGHALMRHVIDMARERGCRIVQLTSNKRRADAIRFYEQIGFAPTHVGFKLYL